MTLRGNELTQNDMRLLALAWHCFEGDFPKVNFKKLAARAGLTNPMSASNAWTRIRNKLRVAAEDLPSPPAKAVRGAAISKSAPLKRSPKKRRKEESSSSELDDWTDSCLSPKASPAGRKVLSPKTVNEAIVKDEDDLSASSSAINDDHLHIFKGDISPVLIYAIEVSLLTT
ncbi:hypothetical protein AC578_9177 [Pseudocercospora eumusae]|uniref:Uncharacterized protein n=1 Tax=Pseudocercospora eumusae TaxID=321146 RepID=A0A139HV52_9PEZI|nr:hypothetical protein AC578_9177 [Pseudocercospora eumusae]